MGLRYSTEQAETGDDGQQSCIPAPDILLKWFTATVQ